MQKTMGAAINTTYDEEKLN